MPFVARPDPIRCQPQLVRRAGRTEVSSAGAATPPSVQPPLRGAEFHSNTPGCQSGFTVPASLGREVLTTGGDSTCPDLSGKYERETANRSYSAFVSITGIGDNDYAGIASFASRRKASAINVTFTGPPSATGQHCFSSGRFRPAGLKRGGQGVTLRRPAM